MTETSKSADQFKVVPSWTWIWTISALIAFAWNSTLCRLALRQTEVGPLAFTMIRLTAGTLVLGLIVWVSNRSSTKMESPVEASDNRFGSFKGAVFLLGYALCFSLAYVALNSGIGALLLFGAVQFTMITSGLIRGERLSGLQWFGFLIAIIGLVVLLAPTSATTTLTWQQLPNAGMMLASGFCWGMYSLAAKGAGDPTIVTAGNFAKATLLAVVTLPAVALFSAELRPKTWDWAGIAYAVLSGSLTSGIGYAIWYRALKSLTATVAATVQLSVPVLVAITGVLILGEQITATLIASAAMILGGVGFVIRFRAASSR